MVVLAIILLIVMGVALIFYPEEMWELEHTEFYLIRARISGVIFLVLGLGAIFYFLIDLIF